MKRVFVLLAVCILSFKGLFSQTDTARSVVEEHYSTGKIWSIGFLIAFIIGIILYFIIKKNPRKDAVR